jgi:hypothetical protein
VTIFPHHVAKLYDYLSRVRSPVVLDDQGLFECWRETDLDDLSIMSGLDFLSTTGRVIRDNDRTLRCRVMVKL